MSIQGNKPSNYFVSQDQFGRKVETEGRMCSHCGCRWEYQPGSGTRRGYCKRCNGVLCGQDLCMKYCVPYMARIEGIEQGKTFKELLKSLDKKYGEKIINPGKVVEQ